ncbi:MAG: VRR-NUC domain-containing protein [Eubacteriales bacterium]|nr:VRR-NUC domain-containing protein [Eubacteriales bacterium]
MRESEFEKKFVREIKKRGALTYKWTSPGCTGVPDRIVIWSPGVVEFVELKSPGRINGLSKRQQAVLAQITTHGGTVHVIDSEEALRRYLDRAV